MTHLIAESGLRDSWASARRPEAFSTNRGRTDNPRAVANQSPDVQDADSINSTNCTYIRQWRRSPERRCADNAARGLGIRIHHGASLVAPLDGIGVGERKKSRCIANLLHGSFPRDLKQPLRSSEYISEQKRLQPSGYAPIPVPLDEPQNIHKRPD